MTRLHFSRYSEENQESENDNGSSTGFQQSLALTEVNSIKVDSIKVALTEVFKMTLFKPRCLYLVERTILVMSSVVIMSQVDSVSESPRLRKAEGEQRSSSAAPFPALSRKFDVNLVSQWHIGLLVSTGFAGILLTCLKRGVLPLLRYQLKMKEHQVNAASVLLQMPWSYSFIWGFISDAVPILDSRRKSYIILAWIMTMLSCFSMALLDQFVSSRAEGNDLTPADMLKHTELLMDVYIFLLEVTNFGCIVALTIGQTYVIAQTRRERITVRGTALGTLLIAQFSGQLFGEIITDYAIFDFTELGMRPKVTVRQTMLFFVFYTVIPLIGLCTCFFEKSDPPPIDSARDRYNRATTENLETSASELQRAYITASNFYQRLKLALRGHWIRLRCALGKESTSRVTPFLIGFVFMSEFSLTYPTNRLKQWCGIDAKAVSMNNSMSEVFSLLPVILWKYFAMNKDWRWCVFSSLVIITMTPQLVYYMMATLNPASRNIDIFAVVSALTAFLRTAIVILQLAITAEIAPVGGEGAFVGIVVSMSTSMRLMANTVSNLIGFMFKDVENAVSGKSDPDWMQVAFALVLSHIIRVLGLVALVFLPKQKRHLQRLHRYGDTGNRCTTWWILACLAVSFIISTVFNALAMAPSTSCMGIVGGSGC
ncbi:unnamed protein product [Peronospora destructor]|uniref:Transmembrane protein n=1 Tax=Peronospora destructor TaxID=86335 RepID=A0AAV0U5M7_9STRA|nr:unnamed protein product [Peronospora destructor]